MKYRIKIKEYNDGSKLYVVQKQKNYVILTSIFLLLLSALLISLSLYDGHGEVIIICSFISTILISICVNEIINKYVDCEGFSKIESAKNFIDEKIKQQVKNTNYLKYP